MKRALRAAALAVALSAPASADGDGEVRFITCPVYRDTDAGRKSGCWLADDPATGVRYDVSPAPTKPDWNYEALVEGRVAATQDDPCGGVVLDPARVSVLEGRCPRHMVPAEDYPGRVFVLPNRNVRPLSEPRDTPRGPYTDRTFNLFFDFDRSFLVYQYDDYLLDRMITWIRVAEPNRIVVTGFAATAPAVVSGREIAERRDVARARAEMVVEALVRLGVPPAKLVVRTRTRAMPTDEGDADGLFEPSRRRVEIRAEF